MADLDLLVDYVSHLQGGLERAENLTRAGELGQAVWAYLEVLEVDPDNVPARRQVGQVATAVRQFDLSAPGRRWLSRMRGGFFVSTNKFLLGLLLTAVLVFLLFLSFSIGYSLGGGFTSENPDDLLPASTLEDKPNPSMTGK
jgi:hypothetical protein